MSDGYTRAALTAIALLLAGLLGERILRPPVEPYIPELCGKAARYPCYVAIVQHRTAEALRVEIENACGSAGSAPCVVEISSARPVHQGAIATTFAGRTIPFTTPLMSTRSLSTISDFGCAARSRAAPMSTGGS